MSEAVLMSRDEAIAKNIDALGRQWEIGKVPHAARYYARRNPHRADYKIPEAMGGEWTKREYLQDQITEYLKRMWDRSDAAKTKRDKRNRAHALKVEEARKAALKE